MSLVDKSAIENKFSSIFRENRNSIIVNDSKGVSGIRDEAIKKFREIGLPGSKLESWKNTDLLKSFNEDFTCYFSPLNPKSDEDRIFQCKVPHLDTESISLYNGWYLKNDAPLKKFDDGTIVGSFARAMKEMPDVFERHFNKYVTSKPDGLHMLNTAYAQDGLFIYVPDGVETSKPVQMVNVLNLEERLLVQNRNLVILGKNSKLKLVHCDDSQNHFESFTNTITEVFLDENSKIEYYKLQNLNNESSIVNTTFFHLKNQAELISNMITLNGGMIRNDSHVKLNGTGCKADVMGLYLMDRSQHVDNQVFIDHVLPGSVSNELFKGILDDHATGVFKGHILVREDAQKTQAFQTNRNILLTDKAVVYTKPFLEIYADDVKCSHGATVGQLDEQAMFYIRSRGISDSNARLLLMYAFAAEVIGYISIEPLRNRIDDLVKKRLRGELAICDQCVLHCSEQEKKYTFDIDMGKI
ncbi:MAG: Fe-S cluster assembly protein SufD [Bacteroidales bacterium]|nr:Fe-S cluster assembly protein SufD [Bacteroidales bacterium]